MTSQYSFASSILALAVLATFPAASRAQTAALDRGSVLISGQASFVVRDEGDLDENTTSFIFLPSLQYFVAPGLAVGGELELTHSSRGDFSTTSYGIGPAMSYYFVRESDVQPFIRGSFRIARSKSKGELSDRTSKLFGFRGAGGFLVLLSQAVGVDISVYYDRLQYRDAIDVDLNTFGIAIGIAAFVF